MSDLGNYLKEELTYQERLLESSIKLESFVKKYKKILIAIFVLVVVGLVLSTIFDYVKEQKLQTSNKIYLELLKENASASESELASLNPKLYSLYQFQKAMKSSNSDDLSVVRNNNIDIISDLAKYQVAVLSKKADLISNYSSNSAILKDMSLLSEVYLSIKMGDFNTAKLRLTMIDSQSPVRNIADDFEHFLVSHK